MLFQKTRYTYSEARQILLDLLDPTLSGDLAFSILGELVDRVSLYAAEQISFRLAPLNSTDITHQAISDFIEGKKQLFDGKRFLDMDMPKTTLFIIVAEFVDLLTN